MATDSTRALVTEYTRLLRSFGLSLSEVGEIHGINPQSVLDPNILAAALREEVGPLTEQRLHTLLLDSLRRSDRGFDADLHHWNRLPAVQLSSALDTAGYRFGIRSPYEPAGVCRTADSPIDLGLWPASGGPVSHTTFEYPDTELGNDNYPALIASINDALLDGTGLKIVLLDNELSDWQFFLVPVDLLESLQRRYGDQIEWRGQPLLRSHQPAAFTETIPDAESVDPVVSRRGDSPIDRPRASFEEIAASTTAGPQEMCFDHGDADEPSADSLANATDPTALVADGSGGTGSTVAAESGSFFDQFDDGVQPPSPDTASESAQTADWHTDAGIDDPDDVEELFEQIERAAAETPVDAEDDHQHHVGSSAVLDQIDHENVGDNSTLEDGFFWVDPDELTAAPWEVHDAMTRG